MAWNIATRRPNRTFAAIAGGGGGNWDVEGQTERGISFQNPKKEKTTVKYQGRRNIGHDYDSNHCSATNL